MNTTESNRLIAEFMGFIGSANSHYQCCFGKINRVLPPQYMEFHTSWNWLMPVVEKIEMLGYTFEKNYQENDGDWQSLIVKGNDILFQEFNRDSKLSTFYAVVKFIQWHKNQN